MSPSASIGRSRLSRFLRNTPPSLQIEVSADLSSAVTLFGSEDQDLPHFRIRVVSKTENVSDKDRGNHLEAAR